jgi:hypothetical protein
MKKLLPLVLLLLAPFTARANTFTFTPSDGDLGDFDHHDAVTWGVNAFTIPAGQVITGAKLTITRIWDWQVEANDALFIHLLDSTAKNVTTFADNTNDNVVSDYFGGQGALLGTWTDPNGGANGAHAVTLTYTFTASQLSTLTSYITNATPANNAVFGFGFDADCHYYNDGVGFEITTAPLSVPDSGASATLLGVGLLALGAATRRRLK